jgi:hypothetical protein
MSNYYYLFNDAIGIPDLRCYIVTDSYTFVAFFQAYFVSAAYRSIMHIAVAYRIGILMCLLRMLVYYCVYVPCCEIRGVHSAVVKDSGLLGCDSQR